MTDLLTPPPWKIASVNGFKYREEVPEGYFLEQLCLITARLIDINETLREIHMAIELNKRNIYEIFNPKG